MGKLLDQLRTQRDQRENEVKAPVIKALNYERREKEIAIKAYQEIEFKLGQDIIKLAMDQAKKAIARGISKQFAKYMHKAGAYDEDGDFNFKVSKRYARMAMPDRLTQDVLREYAQWSRPSLRIYDEPMSIHTQLIQIKIPQLNINVRLQK